MHAWRGVRAERMGFGCGVARMDERRVEKRRMEVGKYIFNGWEGGTEYGIWR